MFNKISWDALLTSVSRQVISEIPHADTREVLGSTSLKMLEIALHRILPDLEGQKGDQITPRRLLDIREFVLISLTEVRFDE